MLAHCRPTDQLACSLRGESRLADTARPSEEPRVMHSLAGEG
jgi:hypothetical protein